MIARIQTWGFLPGGWAENLTGWEGDLCQFRQPSDHPGPEMGEHRSVGLGWVIAGQEPSPALDRAGAPMLRSRTGAST